MNTNISRQQKQIKRIIETAKSMGYRIRKRKGTGFQLSVTMIQQRKRDIVDFMFIEWFEGFGILCHPRFLKSERERFKAQQIIDLVVQYGTEFGPEYIQAFND